MVNFDKVAWRLIIDTLRCIICDVPYLDKNNPISVAKIMNPVENMLIMFEVSPRSWHMVSEVFFWHIFGNALFNLFYSSMFRFSFFILLCCSLFYFIIVCFNFISLPLFHLFLFVNFCVPKFRCFHRKDVFPYMVGFIMLLHITFLINQNCHLLKENWSLIWILQ